MLRELAQLRNARLLYGIVGRQLGHAADVRVDFSFGLVVGRQVLFVVSVEKSSLTALRLSQQRVDLGQLEQDLLRVLHPVMGADLASIPRRITTPLIASRNKAHKSDNDTETFDRSFHPDGSPGYYDFIGICFPANSQSAPSRSAAGAKCRAPGGRSDPTEQRCRSPS